MQFDHSREVARRNSLVPGNHAAISRRQVLALIGGATSAALASTTAWASIVKDGPVTSPADILAFLQAVRNGDEAAVGRMLDHEAALARASDDAGRSAFIIAHLSGHAPIATLLRERGLELDIVEAVIAADWDRVGILAKANQGIMNSAHPIGGNPLYASALAGGDEQYRIRALGADSDGRPDGGSGFTPARAAMECSDPLGAWLAGIDILSNGGSANAPQAHGDSVLHGAVRANDLRLVRMVIRKGGDVHATDDAGRTPRELAEFLDWWEGVQLLQQEAGIFRDHRASRFAFDANREPFSLLSINDVPIEGQSRITSLSHFNEERVQELLTDNPLLIHAISTDAELAIEACGHTGQRDIIRMHLDRGAPLSLPTAISLGDLEHARWLLRNDPLLVHERGPHDFPVMWYPAIGKGSVEAAELLLGFGAPIEQESGGDTALHWAALRNWPDLLRYLLEKGANPEAVGYRQDRAGLTPLQLAVAKDRKAAIDVLQEPRWAA